MALTNSTPKGINCREYCNLQVAEVAQEALPSL
jgi:hypothetical protein